MIVITVTLISAMGLAAVVGIIALRPTQDNTQTIIMILGFLSPTVIAVLALLKSTENKENIDALHSTVVDKGIDIATIAYKVDETKNKVDEIQKATKAQG